MNTEEDVVEEVITVLDGMDVPYMIGGGVALAAWAAPRTTHDLDLVVDLPADRIAEFCSHFDPNRYFMDPEVMAEAFARRDQPSLGMYSFSDMESNFKVDLFPMRPEDKAQQTALRKRVMAEVLQGLWAYVCAPDDLLVQKLRWYAASDSERQFRDCLSLVLTDLNRPTRLIDWDYIEEWANELGPNVQQAWAKVKAAVNGVRPNDGNSSSSTR